MELKTNYQYTYFIHPFIINEGKYKEYIIKLLKDKNCKLKIFEKEKDFKMYKYFLPSVRELLFSSYSYGNAKLNEMEKLPLETRAAILNNCPCNIFEYNLNTDIQAKMEDEEGIYFSIRKVDIICFKTGVCFLCIKTSIEDVKEFSDVLNFNYKFKNIYSQASDLANFDNIHIQTDDFSNMETFGDFIKNITCNSNNISNININTESFLTYSYICVDQENWNNVDGFKSLENDFVKYVNNLSADNSINFENNETNTFSKWKYAKIGLTKSSVGLFASSAEINNYTVLPDEFESQYFYTYIINLYKKIYLKKLEAEARKINNIKKIRNKFIKFTNQLWIREITDDEIGTELNNKLHEIFELDALYQEIKNKYDLLYKELNVRKNIKFTICMIIVLAVSIVLNVYNFILLSNK